MRILKLTGSKLADIFFDLPRILVINNYRFFLRIKITNPKKIPNDHSVIFAFNHTTGADPIIALGALRRKIHFIADSANFSNRFTSFFMRRFANSTPIFKKEPKKNINSFKELFLISKEKIIFFGIFPEGDLFKKGKFGKFKGGAAFLSYKTKLPIVPVYIHNICLGSTNEDWVDRHPVLEGISSLFLNTFHKIHIFIGDPIDPMAENIMEEFGELTDKNEFKKILDKITEKLEKEFIKLREEADSFYILKESCLTTKPFQVNEPAVLILENSKSENIKKKKIRTVKNNTTKPLISAGDEFLNPDELISFNKG
jgi:1-acyl-sn-glycerol-3-phosphate acyltransferase